MFDRAHQLEAAIADGDVAAVRKLLDAGPALLAVRFAGNVGLTPLMWAARRRQEAIVAELLARGADVSAVNPLDRNGDGGNTALWFAAQGSECGAAGIVGRLVAAGTPPDARGEHGQTALFIAAAWGNLEVVKCLLDLGADPAVPDDTGRTPLAMLHETLAWCERQQTLTPDQRRFRDAGPRVRDFLAAVTPGIDRGGGS